MITTWPGSRYRTADGVSLGRMAFIQPVGEFCSLVSPLRSCMLGPLGSNSRPKACTKVSETSSTSNRGSRPTRMATSELVFA